MKKLILLCASVTIFSMLVPLNADSISTRIDLGNITFVSISGIGDLYITQGEINSLNIEASNQETLDSVSVSQEGNELSLNCESADDRTIFDKFLGFLSLERDSNVVYHLTLKSLNKLNSNGTGKVFIAGLKTDNLYIINNGVGDLSSKNLTLEKLTFINNGVGSVVLSFNSLSVVKYAIIDLSGAGSFEISQLNVDTLQLTMTGAGKVSVSGKAKNQMLILNGVGNYDSSSFFAEQTELTKNNFGSASINTQRLTVDMNGLGSVDVSGSPKIDIKHKSGMGRINIL